ncbi:MAG: FliM/FliN family flagellar motor switch protein [Rhizobiales bacterium]|nr:FliM/FliN family flagellar motor switch protein [Hyphomicrobiales bacterium]NRB13678.1 FliM/FliN family flagellar motor switch protein [Hyphomicrobiales bacterium]
MSYLNNIKIDLSVVLGRSKMQVHQLLRLGRGAIIDLDTNENGEVDILANDQIVARGEIIVVDDAISIKITEKIAKFF